MARERIEDLGRIAAMIDKILEKGIFRDELVIDPDELDHKAGLLKAYVEGTDELYSDLQDIREIAYGEDKYNQSPDG